MNNLFSFKKSAVFLIILISSSLTFGMFTVYNKNFRYKRYNNIVKPRTYPNIINILEKRNVKNSLPFNCEKILKTNRFASQEKVKIYHVVHALETAENILKEGLKSRVQLAREGKAEVPVFKSTSDHYESIFFQYIEPEEIEQIQPKLWKRKRYNDYCIAIEVDPDKTMFYNPDLRITAPYNTSDREYSENMMLRENTYKKSAVLLKDLIARRKERFNLQKSDHVGFVVFPNPITAEPQLLPDHIANRQTGYYWNEYTVKTDRIDPSNFV